MSQKTTLRTTVHDRLKRERQTLSRRTAKVQRYVTEKLLSLPRQSVAFYHARWDEPDLMSVMHLYYKEGGQVLLPVASPGHKQLIFRLWTPETSTLPGLFGILEPTEDHKPRTPTLLFVPMVAFDAAGHRLGRGRGYYDVTLHVLRSENPEIQAYGVAFELQRFPELPTEDHDAHLDGLITDEGIYVF